MPVKIPICTFDAKTGILCPRCESKLKSGQIRESDIAVSRALVTLADKASELNKITFHRSYEVEGNYILEVEPSDVPLIRSNRELLLKLEQELNGKVWIVGSSNSDRRFLEDLFYPIRILTVNIVWLPDGSKLTKVIIPGRKSERLVAELELLKKVVKEVKGIELMVETEREATPRI